MQTLPEEVQENILLSLSEPDDLLRACSLNRLNRDICSGSSFWREKFAREGLPLVQEGYTFSSWSTIYKRAFYAAQLAEEMIASGEQFRVRLANVFNLQDLDIPPNDDIRKAWYEMRESDNRITINYVGNHDSNYTFIDDLCLVFKPFTRNNYVLDIVNFQTIIDDNQETVHYFTIPMQSKPVFSVKETWNVIYRIFFFGYD